MKLKLDSNHLKDCCEPVNFDNPKLNLKLAQHLFQLMLKEEGIGLAANQVGLKQRIFVMSVNNKCYHCFNPEILETDNNILYYKEGCLSFPKEYCSIPRPDKIQVKYFDSLGVEHIEWLDGIASRCFQHELDHLNGLTMHDRKDGQVV